MNLESVEYEGEKPKKVSRRNIYAVSLLAIAGNFAWMVENQYYNVYLYNVIAPRPLYVSLIVAFSAVVSTLTAIIMGAYSDSIGKRRPLFIFGFLFWPIFTAMFPLASVFEPIWLAVFMAILFDCIMSFFGATATDAALNAFSADITTVENRGKIGAILEFGLLITTLLVYGSAGFLIDFVGYNNFFYIYGALVAIIGIPGAFLAKDSPTLRPSGKTTWGNLVSTFRIQELKQNKDAFKVLFITTLWGIGFQTFFSYVLIYLQHNIQLDLIRSSLLMFVALFIAAVASFPMGKWIDRFGRKKICLIAIVGECVSLILFAFFKDFIALVIFGTIWVFFMMTFDISSQTWMKDLFPKGKTAQFCGYWVFFKVLLTMAPGSLLGAWISETWGESIVLDGIPGFVPPNFIFIVGAVLLLLALIPLALAKDISRRGKNT
jgi:MFS family permease